MRSSLISEKTIDAPRCTISAARSSFATISGRSLTAS
jgi:hypothetical protein